MEFENSDIFFVLLRLKSYLISLLDNPDSCDDSFEYTHEYLERRYPEQKEYIIDLLMENGITNDCEIAFNEKIHLKFRDIALKNEPHVSLNKMLDELEIKASTFDEREKAIDDYKNSRERKLKSIVEVLYQIARLWASRNELENKVDDYSALEEEEVIRPSEEETLTNLDERAVMSFFTLSKLTKIYLEMLADYYFEYGGDIALREFADSLDDYKSYVEKKYKNLFRISGLNNDPGDVTL